MVLITSSWKMLRKNCTSFGLQSMKIRKFLSTNKPTDISYFHHVGKEPLSYRTIGQQLKRAAQLYGNREAIVSCHENKRLTFSEALYEADRVAAGLLQLGLKRGDIIGIWAPNTIQWYLTTMASARAGLISVGLNPAYQVPEIDYCIKKVGIKAIIASETFKTQNYYEMLSKILPQIKSTKPSKQLDNSTISTVIIDSKNELPGTYKFDDLFTLASEEETKQIEENSSTIQPDDPCNLQFTSGSTGQPKAAYLSHFNYVNNGIHIGTRCEYHLQPHRISVQVPFFHVYGIVICMMAATAHGATLVLPSPTFQAEKSLEAIQKESCTVITGTPTMYIDLLAKQKQLKIPISSATLAVTGGAPCPPQLFRRIKECFSLKRICTVFGLTETTASAFFSMPGESEVQTTETVGHLIDHLEAKVIDENGEIVPMGVPGELCVRGYCTMLGYFNDEVKTREVMSNDKWLRTGDQFILQKDGYGKIVGRLKDMIIRGGENIFPKEIEDFFATHPEIMENYVFGVPDDRMGEEVCVFMRTTGRQLTASDVKQFASGKIAHFKIPRFVKVVDGFPKTTSGKIQKFKLRELFLEMRKNGKF